MKTTVFAAAVAAAMALAVPVIAQAADDVATRQAIMKDMGGQLKVLGDMSKGAMTFDAGKARAALMQISGDAGKIPADFQSKAMGGDSKAKPEIWQNWDDFRAKANDLQSVAASAADNIVTASDLSGAMRNIGGACSACHQSYRSR